MTQVVPRTPHGGKYAVTKTHTVSPFLCGPGAADSQTEEELEVLGPERGAGKVCNKNGLSVKSV